MYEQLALQETIVLKEIAHIQEELYIIRAKIEYVRKFNLPEHQNVISIPSLETSKIETIPECPATGKETTNLVNIDDLPKIMTEVQTSITSVKPSDLNLRPNEGIQIPLKSEGQTLADLNRYQRVKSYYVLYNGPNPGIYTSWNIAEQAIKGFLGVNHKKF